MRKFYLFLSVLWLWTCGGGGGEGSSPTEPVDPDYVVSISNLQGQAQKGPFSNGTSITIAELSSALSPTGRNFSSAINDNSGRFNVSNVQLVSPFVELRANGFYFDEVSNSLSDAQLTLFAISNLTNKTSLNVNILTHLEKNRILNLMSGSTSITFAQAKVQAQEEVLNIFDISRNNMPDSELLDVSQNSESNAKLLAISAIVQGQLTVAQMSELLANISTDISTDGILNNQQIMDTLISNSKNLDLSQVRSNLEARYASLGISANIPNFEEQVNQFLKPPIANDMSISTDEDTAVNVALDASDPEGDELTFSIVETNNGTVTLNGNIAAYTPNANFNGTDTFTYFANDGTSNSNTATVTVEVGAVDDEPQTNDIDVQTDEDVALVFNLTAEEYDGDSYSFAIISQPTNGSINLDGVSITYTPNQDYYGSDSFTYEATDDTGRSLNIGTATITINPVNDAPVANDITNQVTDENRMMQLDITLDATDIEGDDLTYSVVSTNNGSVTLSDNIATYVPNQDWNGEDTFTYIANDGTLDSNTATVTITVNAVNDAPVTTDQTASTDEDTAVEISLTSSDVEGDTITYSIITDVSNGATSLSGSTVTYTPTANFYGTETFTFKANDGIDDSNTSTVSITVASVNDAPVAYDVTASMDENKTAGRYQPVTITMDASDVEGDALTFSIVGSPINGTLGSITNNQVVYTPNQDYNGEDTFTYIANDGTLDSNTATVTITVNAVNDAPEATNSNIVVDEDSSISISLASLVSDVDGDNLTYHGHSSGQGIYFSLNQTNGDLTITAENNYNGPSNFAYYVNDGALDSNIADILIAVNPVNDAPETFSGSLETDEDISLTIDLNAPQYTNDIDSDDFTFNLSYDASNASWETSEDNADITMTPDENWSGILVLTFTANDGELTSNASSILITVNAVNDAPVASDGTDSNPEDTRMYAQLSATDVDTDVNELSYYIVTAPENVTLCYDTPEDPDNGECTNVLSAGDLSPSAPFVIPDANWNGTTTFTWKANDGTDDSNIATNTIMFSPVDDEPVTNNIAVDVDEDSSIDITLTAEEYDGDTYSFSIIDQPSNGSLALSGVVASYTPNENYNGSDSFTFEATDDTGRSMNVATATITINPVNDAPVTSDVATGTDEDTNVVINLVGSDVENDDLTFNIESTPSNGSVVIVDNTAIYTPNKDYNGTDKFTYTANDGELTSNISSVTITINEINDAPIVEDIRVTLNENRLITTNFDEKESSDIKFTINSNRSGSVYITLTADDPEGDTLVFSIVETNAGAVSLEDNVATYTPSQDWNGVDTFSFKAFDGELESNVAKVILSVNPQNDAPTVKDMTITTSEDTDIEFILDGTDIDGDNLHYSIVTDVVIGDNNIILENNTGPNVIFEPGNNWYGTEQFTYRANDGSLDSNVAQVTLVVSSVNDAPTANDVTATVSETRTARSYFTLDGNDVDGDVLEYIITENVSNGTVSLNGAEVNYVPSQNFVGQDTLKYKVNDGVLDSNIAAAYITISAVNDAPVAEEIYSSVDEDSSVEITLKASDVESESLNYYVSKSSSNATLEQVASKITYAPNTDFYGYDSFQYYAVDEDSQVSNIATVHVNVSPMEDSPKLEDTDTTIYYTLEYGVPDTISFTNFPDVDPDGDAVTYYFKGDSTKYSFSSTTQDTLYCIDCSGENSASIYGIDEKGNQGASSAFTVNLIGGPQGLAAVEEYTAGYLENNELRDPAVSYVPWASLGRTGYIIENRAGEVNATPYARDFDRFNYWTEKSQFHIELDFSQESLAWDYVSQTINGYVPFTAYLIDAFDNSKEQLFAGYWESDGVSGFSNPGDGTQWAGPVYGAAAWEPIYLFLPQDGVVYGDEAQYISDNDLETSGGIGWASSNSRELRSSLDFGDPPSVTYPLMTATIFTDYLGSGVLPTADGLTAWGSEWAAGGASSVLFRTSFEIYDNPDGTNNSRNSMENTFNRSSEEVLLPQMNFNRKFSSDEFMYEQGIEQ